MRRYTLRRIPLHGRRACQIPLEHLMNANDPIAHQAKVDAARESMGTKYLCHPANRVQAKVNYPCRHSNKNK